ncbi:hypothetical protein MNB_SV-9-703 [hydrothermal vent metagenome]|uniref:Uncharacterized protein n=1 Tax=hydrothermal vent metagenome TaxID=652676 RepID=A0A1W1BWE7_9ZZZZ
MKFNYKLLLPLIAIIFISFTTSIVAQSEAEKLKQVDKDEKAMIDMFNEECGNTKCDKNATK